MSKAKKKKEQPKALFAPASKKQEMILNSTAQITVIGGAAGCCPAATEFLTPSGWVRFDQYKEGMEVAEYDAITDTLHYRKPQAYVKLPCEELTQLKGKGLQMTLSDEHTVLYWNSARGGELSQPKTQTFKEVKRRHEASKTKGWAGKIKTTFKSSAKGIDVSEGELRLQVAVKADGRVVKEGKDNYTQMRFSKERKYLRLLELCKKFGLKHKDNGWKPTDRYKSGKEYDVIVWPLNADKRFTSDWYLCTQQQLETIADEVGHWDGSIVPKSGGNTLRYFSKYKEDCDFIQYVFAANGMNTSLVYDDREHSSWTTNGQHRGKGLRSFANKDRKNELSSVPTVDGYKYCFTTSTGFLVVREEGKIFLTGNSGKSYLLQLMPLLLADDPNSRCLMFRRTTPQLTGQGGIWETAQTIYNQLPKQIRPKFRTKPYEAQFPHPVRKGDKGMTVRWQSMEHEKNKLDIQGLTGSPFTK